MMNKKLTSKSNVICKKRYGIIWNTPAMMYDFGDEHKFSSMEIGVKLNPGDKYRADYDGRNDVWVIGNRSLMFKMDPKTFANLFDFIENEEKND